MYFWLQIYLCDLRLLLCSRVTNSVCDQCMHTCLIMFTNFTLLHLSLSSKETHSILSVYAFPENQTYYPSVVITNALLSWTMITGTNELAKQNKITQDMLKVCLQACPVLVQGWTILFLGCQVSGEVLILQRRCIHDLMQKYAAKFQPFQLYKQIIVGNMHPIYLFMLMYANQRCKFLTSFWKKML